MNRMRVSGFSLMMFALTILCFARGFNGTVASAVLTILFACLLARFFLWLIIPGVPCFAAYEYSSDVIRRINWRGKVDQEFVITDETRVYTYRLLPFTVRILVFCSGAPAKGGLRKALRTPGCFALPDLDPNRIPKVYGQYIAAAEQWPR